MKSDDAKAMADVLNELSESYADLTEALKATSRHAKETKQLWRKGKRSVLIKVGLALIAFPDPTISDIVGSALVAAGMVQEGIRHRTLHVDDVYKTFQNTMKELRSAKEQV
ncbi:hypothetical protein COS86_03840 [Candidatus Bathyarchaeota archaeon CG07_land_8_20_14_0_80_47_9]|jgi:hypothetical protein|nr:MAG: hypothetical protein COS86_03840 [Candidatus Bathyarchaeota archaeon CG07_land_8_20_14_0_80_47_9]